MIGVFVVGMVMLLQTFWINAAKNFLSRLVFVIVPFFSGMYLVIYSMVHLGWFDLIRSW
jgi:Na+/H+ antiporter NhaD/arsenite permease-like protein